MNCCALAQRRQGTAIPVKLRLLAAAAPRPPRRPARREGDHPEQAGIYVRRTACPIAGIPAGTGDITLFNPAEQPRLPTRSTWPRRSPTCARTCDETGDHIVSTSRPSTSVATRRDGRGARRSCCPISTSSLQGGSKVVAKRVGRVGLSFAAGQLPRQTSGQATLRVARARPRPLPEDIRRQITRQRKAGDADAAIDPMADPAVRAAVASAHVRASGRLPADPGPAALQRHALTRFQTGFASTSRARKAKAAASPAGLLAGRPRGRVRDGLRGSRAEGATAPGISQAKGPRAPDTLESVRRDMRRTTEGVSRLVRRGESSQVAATEGALGRAIRAAVAPSAMSRGPNARPEPAAMSDADRKRTSFRSTAGTAPGRADGAVRRL